ncbi:MAG: prepilin peptidase [Aquabacterium sp.]
MPALPMEWLLSVPALAVLGLLVGSFLNVVAHRFPLMLERQWWSDVATQLGDEESHHRVLGQAMPEATRQVAVSLQTQLDALSPLGLSRPASRCPSCGQAIRWHQNVPFISWLVLRGRCACCAQSISVRYPVVEVATAVLFAAVGWRFGPTPMALWYCGLVGALLALSLIDWDTTVLPDDITLPLLWAGLAGAALGAGVALADSIWGAVAGYLSLWSVYWLFKLATGKEGMGHGDFKLLAALGAWLGWQALLPVILAASVLGALVGIGMKVTGSLREGRYVPFGPFLAGAGIVILLLGNAVVLRWMGWA